MVDEAATPTKGNLETFICRFKNIESIDEFKIISLKVKHSKLDKGVPIEVDNYNAGTDISTAITELIEQEIIILENLSNIEKFSLSYSKTNGKGIRKTVLVKENDDGTLILKVNKKELKDDERDEFANLFRQRFGIGLNIPLDPTNLVANKKHIIDHLLSEEHIDNPRQFHKEIIEKLEGIGILITKPTFQLKCKNPQCGHKMRSDVENDNCTECGSSTYLLNESIKLEISDIKTKKYLQEILGRCAIIEVQSDIIRQINNKKFNFKELIINSKPVYLYINNGRISKKLLDYLVRSALPILFVSIRKISNTIYLEDKLFEHIYLSDIIIDEDNSIKGIEERLIRLQSYSQEKISTAARSSISSLKSKINNPQEYEPKDFEIDVFNIMKQIFPTAYKAGGKLAPEGIVGLEYKTNKKYKKVFEWDCKLAQTDEYKLPRSEIDKACRYIRSTLKSSELKIFNNHLNHYIIISNAINPVVFKNFANALNKRKYWKGKKTVVLFHTDALIELHNLYAQHQDDIIRRHNIFYEEYFKILDDVDEKLGYVNIEKTNISDLFSSVLAQPAENRELDGKKVEAHLVKDED